MITPYLFPWTPPAYVWISTWTSPQCINTLSWFLFALSYANPSLDVVTNCPFSVRDAISREDITAASESIQNTIDSYVTCARELVRDSESSAYTNIVTLLCKTLEQLIFYNYPVKQSVIENVLFESIFKSFFLLVRIQFNE